MRGRNPLATLGLLFSILGSGPIGLTLSILGLRRADETGEGRGRSIAGITISVASMSIAVVAALTLLTAGGNPPVATAADLPRPTGTTVTVAPAVADATEPGSARDSTAAEVTALAHRQRSLAGKTFAVQGIIAATEPDVAAVIGPGDGSDTATARVILRGSLVADYDEDDEFRATVTVTTGTFAGLPVLTVSDIDLA